MKTQTFARALRGAVAALTQPIVNAPKFEKSAIVPTLFAAVLFAGAAPAIAHDTIEVAVDGFTGAAPTIVDPAVASPLTFRDNGNVTINYVVNALSFTSGELGRFTLHMKTNDTPSSTMHEPTYPVAVSSSLNGENLPLIMSPLTSMSLSGLASESSREIVVSINCAVAADACPTTDGAQIDRQLQFGAASSLNIRTTVKVHVIVTLVHPEVGECLGMANFVTDQGWTERVGSTEVIVIANGRNAGTVRATTPYGQLSQNVVVVSDCGEVRNFDLKIDLDPTWETNPNNNPGNAVFTYYSDEEIDLATYVPEVLAETTPQGQQLCLSNLYLNPDESLIATVHMQVQRGIPSSTLPMSPDEFVYSASIYEPDTICGGGTEILAADDAIVEYITR